MFQKYVFLILTNALSLPSHRCEFIETLYGNNGLLLHEYSFVSQSINRELINAEKKINRYDLKSLSKVGINKLCSVPGCLRYALENNEVFIDIQSLKDSISQSKGSIYHFVILNSMNTLFEMHKQLSSVSFVFTVFTCLLNTKHTWLGFKKAEKFDNNPNYLDSYTKNCGFFNYSCIGDSVSNIAYQFRSYVNKAIESRTKTNKIQLCTQESISIMFHLSIYKEKIIAKLRETDYEKNIFLMMKFRDKNYYIYDALNILVQSLGYNLVRADMPDWNITHSNVQNPFAVLHCCKYGIALFDEPETGSTFNSNVVAELTLMQALQRNCILLKDGSITEQLPFDTNYLIYKSYSNIEEIKKHVKDWVSGCFSTAGK